MTARMASLAHDRRGSFASEFAMVMPFLAALVIGMLEVFLVMFTQGALQSAVGGAARLGTTGQQEGDRRQAILAQIEERTFGLIDTSMAEIDVLVYPRFADIGQPEPFTDLNGNGQWDPGEPFSDINGNGVHDDDMGVAGLGGPEDIVLYRLRYSSNMVSGIFRPIFGEVH